MNYWIFVIGGFQAPEVFQRLLVMKNWGFWVNSAVRKKVESLRRGDVVIFYVGGQNAKYLAGEAKLTSNICKPNRASINMPERGPLGGMVYFDNIDVWDDKKVYLTDIVREQLDFIKNKRNWGSTFRQSIVSITERDYYNIRQLSSK